MQLSFLSSVTVTQFNRLRKICDFLKYTSDRINSFVKIRNIKSWCAFCWYESQARFYSSIEAWNGKLFNILISIVNNNCLSTATEVKITCNFELCEGNSESFEFVWFKKCSHVIIFRKAFTSNWELFGSNRLFSGCSSNELYFERTKLLNRKPGSFRSFS